VTAEVETKPEPVVTAKVVKKWKLKIKGRAATKRAKWKKRF